MFRLLLSIALLTLAVAGCGQDDPSAPGTLDVVATTTQAADLARNVGSARAKVRALLPANADPHDYELRPSDVDALVEADLIVRSGGELDEWLAEAIESAGADAPVVTLIDHVQTRGEDPHWWHDPRNAVTAVDAIREAFVRADPDGAQTYRSAAERYQSDIRALDQAVAACLSDIPDAQRKLITTHDALGYFAERYGIEVIGAVIPSLSTQAQASAGETAALVETIRREKVRAIFAEASVEARLERAIARDAGAVVGDPLYADTLGPAGGPGGTYLGSIAANTRALAEGFTGEPARCDLPG